MTDLISRLHGIAADPDVQERDYVPTLNEAIAKIKRLREIIEAVLERLETVTDIDRNASLLEARDLCRASEQITGDK